MFDFVGQIIIFTLICFGLSNLNFYLVYYLVIIVILLWTFMVIYTLLFFYDWLLIDYYFYNLIKLFLKNVFFNDIKLMFANSHGSFLFNFHFNKFYFVKYSFGYIHSIMYSINEATGLDYVTFGKIVDIFDACLQLLMPIWLGLCSLSQQLLCVYPFLFFAAFAANLFLLFYLYSISIQSVVSYNTRETGALYFLVSLVGLCFLFFFVNTVLYDIKLKIFLFLSRLAFFTGIYLVLLTFMFLIMFFMLSYAFFKKKLFVLVFHSVFRRLASRLCAFGVFHDTREWSQWYCKLANFFSVHRRFHGLFFIFHVFILPIFVLLLSSLLDRVLGTFVAVFRLVCNYTCPSVFKFFFLGGWENTPFVAKEAFACMRLLSVLDFVKLLIVKLVRLVIISTVFVSLFFDRIGFLLMIIVSVLLVSYVFQVHRLWYFFFSAAIEKLTWSRHLSRMEWRYLDSSYRSTFFFIGELEDSVPNPLKSNSSSKCGSGGCTKLLGITKRTNSSARRFMYTWSKLRIIPTQTLHGAMLSHRNANLLHYWEQVVRSADRTNAEIPISARPVIGATISRLDPTLISDSELRNWGLHVQCPQVIGITASGELIILTGIGTHSPKGNAFADFSPIHSEGIRGVPLECDSGTPIRATYFSNNRVMLALHPSTGCLKAQSFYTRCTGAQVKANRIKAADHWLNKVQTAVESGDLKKIHSVFHLQYVDCFGQRHPITREVTALTQKELDTLLGRAKQIHELEIEYIESAEAFGVFQKYTEYGSRPDGNNQDIDPLQSIADFMETST